MSNDLEPDAPVGALSRIKNPLTSFEFDVALYATLNELDEHEVVLESLAEGIHFWGSSSRKEKVLVEDEDADEEDEPVWEYQDVDNVMCHFYLNSDAVEDLRLLKSAHSARLVVTQNNGDGAPVFQHSFYLDTNTLKFSNLFGDKTDEGRVMSWTMHASCVAVELFETVPQAEVDE